MDKVTCIKILEEKFVELRNAHGEGSDFVDALKKAINMIKGNDQNP